MNKSLLIAAAALLLVALAYSTNHAEEQESAVTPDDNTAATTESSDAKASPLKRAGAPTDPDDPNVDPEKVDWAKIDWRKRLTREEFVVMRLAGTERAFSGEYWDFYKDGAYKCRGCGLPLFESDSKFDSHCGWPSFDKEAIKGNIVEIEDNSHGMHRVEVRCRRCNAHLGHIFDDGPTETGLRYCINSPSIKFVPAEAEEKEKAAAKKSAGKDAAETAVADEAK